jgi:hypothetical protein
VIHDVQFSFRFYDHINTKFVALFLNSIFSTIMDAASNSMPVSVNPAGTANSQFLPTTSTPVSRRSAPPHDTQFLSPPLNSKARGSSVPPRHSEGDSRISFIAHGRDENSSNQVKPSGQDSVMSDVANAGPSDPTPLMQESATGNPAMQEPAAGNPAMQEPAAGNPALQEPAPGNPAMQEPASGTPPQPGPLIRAAGLRPTPGMSKVGP